MLMNSKWREVNSKSDFTAGVVQVMFVLQADKAKRPFTFR